MCLENFLEENLICLLFNFDFMLNAYMFMTGDLVATLQKIRNHKIETF